MKRRFKVQRVYGRRHVENAFVAGLALGLLVDVVGRFVVHFLGG